ncbi:MAG: hypothetical protein ACTHMJ_07340 [Thermomicrobiales bacterium]
MTHYFTIRYRYSDGRGRIAFVVDDGRGNAYLFSGGRLQAGLTGSGACARLTCMLSRIGMCAPVFDTTPHTLDSLRQLTASVARIPLAVYQTTDV